MTVKGGKMNDVISRQAAVDALRYAQHRFTVADEAGGMGTVKWSEDVIYFAAAERVLTELPSAEPAYTDEQIQKMQDLEQAQLDKAYELGKQAAQPEQQWIPCSEHPDTDRNVFIARGKTDFLSCCIGHYDHNAKLWYEDRNWFAKIMYDAMYWCEMPPLPEPWKGEEHGQDD